MDARGLRDEGKGSKIKGEPGRCRQGSGRGKREKEGRPSH